MAGPCYEELCSAQVPNTVSDLLSQYFQVYCVAPGKPGYEEATRFLRLDDEDDDLDEDEDDEDDERRADEEAEEEEMRKGVAQIASAAAGGLGAAEVDSIIRLLGGLDDGLEDDDEDDEDDEDDDMDGAPASDGMLLPPPRGHGVSRAAVGGDGRPVDDGSLHIAQDVDGGWRWLEDDLGRTLPARPEGEYTTRLMSVEQMVQLGLNVNSLHEEVDPAELVDFSGCRSWVGLYKLNSVYP